MTTLVTGANGFVGSALSARLRRDGMSVRGVVRSLVLHPSIAEAVEIGNLSSKTNWTEVLNSVHQIVHLAACVHVVNKNLNNQLNEFRRINVESTANLASQAAAAGVKRFVFLSSIKVNGECTGVGKPFTPDDAPAPEDPYSVSKWEAEQSLNKIATETGMEVVIIRPPLVYGPRVKANFESMMRWLERGIPLPLAAVTQNRRSLVALENLVDLIVTCLNHPKAANQTFLVSDGEDLSTVELLERMGSALGRPARLFYTPTGLLRLGTKMVNKSSIYKRLCCSLQLDIAKTHQLLGWNPVVSVGEGMRRAVEGLYNETTF